MVLSTFAVIPAMAEEATAAAEENTEIRRSATAASYA